MSVTVRTTILSLAAVLLAVPDAWGAAEPVIYGSITSFAGKGKHPKSAVSGLIVDSTTSGRKLVCYSYSITTDSKIKGQVSGTVERISGAGVERLGTFGKMNVLDFGSLPVPPDLSNDPCAPENPEGLDSNFGFAADCIEISTQLQAGDIIRFDLGFKKAAKLKGAEAGVSIFGSLLPSGAAAPAVVHRQPSLEWAVEMTRGLAANR